MDAHDWLYYDDKKKGHSCKKFEMCPFEATWCGGINRSKFVTVALNSLGDHPICTLHDHENSNNHVNAVRAYNG